MNDILVNEISLTNSMLIADIIQEEDFSSLACEHTSEAGRKVMTVYWQFLKHIQLRQRAICRCEASVAKMDNPISIHMLCSHLINTAAVQDKHNVWTRDAT
jgi:hypothetical protein